MPLDLTVEDVGVDSGTILVADLAWYGRVKHGDAIDPAVMRQVKVPPGVYRLGWSVPQDEEPADEEDDECGEERTIDGEGELLVTSGTVVVSDPCYAYGQDKAGEAEWLRDLKEFDYFRQSPEGCVVLDKIHDDGSYEVRLTLRRIRDAPGKEARKAPPQASAEPTVPCRLSGEDGNVFAVIARARRALKNAGRSEKAEEMGRRCLRAKSYEDALGIVQEYVHDDPKAKA